MASASQAGFSLVNAKIQIEGAEALFSQLIINQALADVNSFSFTWIQPQGEVNLQSHISFYKKYLSKEVSINIQDNFTFKGIITAIDCLKQDVMGAQYSIKGKGLFAKMDEVPECNSFTKQTIKQIFTALSSASGLTLKGDPKNSNKLFYTVQYNQTGFEFYKLMAARYGEWLFYNGKEMVLGPPPKDAVTLTIEQDVNDISISAQVRKASVNNVGFDIYKGEALTEKKSAPSSSAALVDASVKGGESMFGSSQTGIHMPHAANKEVLADIVKLQQQAALSGTVYLSGHSYNSKVKLGGRIKLQLDGGKADGEYIVIEVQHFCTNNNNYENQFVAVPAEVEVPPYTNPFLFTQCKPQPALVKLNEDKDGLDRIKVNFPWQKPSDTTPWINVLTPHAGKDKGFRFLTEIGEEVLIGFIDNNAERPFMMGAVHTEKTKSANPEAGNNLKAIGTRTGRRLEIDDDKGAMLLYDNYTDATPKNALLFERKDDKLELMLQSQKDSNAFSVIAMKNEEYLNLGVMSGGTLITEIRLEKGGKKITIKSAGSIELNADQKISMSAPDIEITASNELKLNGTGKGVALKGMKVGLTADSTMEVKGIQTTVEGSAKLDLKGGALASLAGGLVKIN